MTRHKLRLQPEHVGQQADSTTGASPEVSYARKRPRNTSEDDEKQLCPQQRYAKPPKHPGMVTFDSGLRELPLQCGGRIQTPPQLPLESYKEQLLLLEAQCHQGCERAKARARSEHLNVLLNKTGVVDETQTANSQASDQVFTMKQLTEALPDTSSSLEDFSDKPNTHVQAIHDTPTFSMALYFLELDTKLIYVDLVNTKHISLQVNTTTANSVEAFDMPAWRMLGGLRAALLRPEHDLLSITQDITAPDSLRRLAVKYGSPAGHGRIRMKIFIEFLELAPRQLREQMIGFAQIAINFLDRFEPSYPSVLRGDLQLMSTYTHAYLKEIFDIDFLESCNYHHQDFPPTDSTTQTKSPNTEHQPRELDERLRTRYLQQFEHPPMIPAEEVDMHFKANLPLKDYVLCFLLGWLCVGPLMADTFHDFSLVFKFLAWYGAGCSDIWTNAKVGHNQS